jgi:hypothetical protein
VWDEASRSLTHIKGLPVDPDRMYSVAVTFQALDGLDNITPLVEYRRAHFEQFPKSAEAGKGMKEILVTHYSLACWWSMLQREAFEDIDVDRSGSVSREEIRAAAERFFGGDVEEKVSRADLESGGAETVIGAMGCWMRLSIAVFAWSSARRHRYRHPLVCADET